MVFFLDLGVLFFSGEPERSNSYRVESTGSNPIHRYNFYFLIFSATTSPGTQPPKLMIIVNSNKLRINDNH